MIRIAKRSFLFLAALAAVMASPPDARAQAWPQRSIMLVVPFPAGGGTDAFARPLAAQLDAQLGQRVLIENKAGAGGNVGASYAAKQPADGYTFFIGASHHTIAPSIYPKLDYDIEKDFTPVALISRPPHVVAVNLNVPARTLHEFIVYARANDLNYASGGAGTTHHLAGELFNIMARTHLKHVPYRGSGPAMQDLLAGHVPIMFDGLGTSGPQIAAGAIRGLAVTTTKRVAALPDVPTAAEAGLPGFEFSTWYGVFAPKGTPAPVVERMAKEIRTALQSPAIQETWAKNGSDIPDVTGEKFKELVSFDVARWHKVVQEAGIRLD